MSQPKNHHHSPATQNRLRKIRVGFVIFHVTTILMGTGMITLALVVRHLEVNVSRELHLDITERVRLAFYSVGSSIVLNSILGFVALWKKKKPYFWMIYCTILGCLVLVTLTASGSAISLDFSLVRRNMLTLMQSYEDETRRKVVQRRAVALIDEFQENYKCCGVNSYKDWQDVEFGRTSLKVPRSCCKLLTSKGQRITSKFIRLTTLSPNDLQRYNDCGLLCLPEHQNVTKFLYTRGCFDRIFGTLRLFNVITGWFGCTVGLIFAIGFLLTAYLIGSNGI